MTSRDFCFWLQGYFEIEQQRTGGNEAPVLGADQVDCIRKHLALVFKHEIDPAIEATSPATKAELDKVHAGPGKPSGFGGVDPMTGLVMRC